MTLPLRADAVSVTYAELIDLEAQSLAHLSHG